MYLNIEPVETPWSKIRRSSYLIVSITLLTHTMSITYSMMTFKQQSAGFISIIVSSLVCYFLSASHLTIYGISILGILYLKMLEGYYTRSQLHYIVAISGAIIFPFWKAIRYVDTIFDSFPGRIHASMVFGISLITLVKFFPLSIQNIQAFFIAANSSALTNPITIIIETFSSFNILTLLLTIGSIVGLFLMRDKLNKLPLIAFLVVIGIVINSTHVFESQSNLCEYPDVDCNFYIIKISNIIPPSLPNIILLIPAAAVMTIILIYEQFLYLQEFQRRGKRYFGQGNLGETQRQSKILGLANIISGLLGGLPICINLFATYQNFSFNVKNGYKGTKLVGLMQIPVSYALYSILSWFYEIIPLFILFVVVATPTIYFLTNMLKIHSKNIVFISCLAALNVLTHPIIALIMAAFTSIYDLSLLLKATPAEILLENVQNEGERKSVALAQIVEPQPAQNAVFVTQFSKRVIEIQTDQPAVLDNTSYVLYRFTGAISYLNYFEHVEEINCLIEKYVKSFNIPILLSFRYSQIIDEQSLEELALYLGKLRDVDKIEVILTGLHKKLIGEMEKISYFQQMLQENQKSMYRLDNPNA